MSSVRIYEYGVYASTIRINVAGPQVSLLLLTWALDWTKTMTLAFL